VARQWQWRNRAGGCAVHSWLAREGGDPGDQGGFALKALSALGQLDRLHERLATVSRGRDGGWRGLVRLGAAYGPWVVWSPQDTRVHSEECEASVRWRKQTATRPTRECRSTATSATVGVLDRQTYQGGTRGSRLCGEDRDRETENSKVCTRTRETRFIQVRVARVASPTSYLGDQVWRPALG
jgi:hypothetical protein